ncbi:GNAT family N-acetyltransferase [Streptomyces xiangluensis]|uniref:GNAT family N-acetyltransferase n=1 Tax=Streptomyces xiangluensis TaxID=2665720 RepID=A0ABV8Z5D6_9ACTN
MQVTVVAPGELGAAHLAAWRAMQDADPELASPFLAPEFVRAVGHQRPAARVAVLSDGQRPVGFFPFERHWLGLGLPIGSGLCDRQGLIHAPDLAWDPAALLRACRLQLWRYDHLTAGQAPFETLGVHHMVSPVIELGHGFDSYFASLRSKSLRGTKRLLDKERRLSRRIGEVRLAFDDSAPEALEALMRCKSAQYRSKGQLDLFSRPWAVALLRELLRSRAANCTGTLSVLYAGERPVAWHFGLRSRRVLQYWFPAYDPDVAPFSPGILLLLKMAEAAASLGIHHIDLGKGAEPYKQQLKTGDHRVAEGWVRRPTVAATMRRAQAEAATKARVAVADNPALRRAALFTLNAFPSLRKSW